MAAAGVKDIPDPLIVPRPTDEPEPEPDEPSAPAIAEWERFLNG